MGYKQADTVDCRARFKPKRYHMGLHHHTNAVGQAQYQEALAQLFHLQGTVRLIAHTHLNK